MLEDNKGVIRSRKLIDCCLTPTVAVFQLYRVTNNIMSQQKKNKQ